MRKQAHTNFLKRISLLLLIAGGLTSCSMDASIRNSGSLEVPQNRVTPDTVVGEVVQSFKGNYRVRAAFGEISEKTKSKNGTWNVEGTFYE